MKTTLRLILTLIILATTATSWAEKPVISVLGDSYSTYEGKVWPTWSKTWYKAEKRDNTDVSAPEQTWWGLLTTNDAPYRLGVNNSFSGSTICLTGYHKDDYSDRAFITRMCGLGNPDIILIFGGTNDAWASVPMGEYKDSGFTRADLFNYRPALIYLLKNLHELYPEASVYFMLNSELSDDVDNSSKEICSRYGATLVELEDIEKQAGHPTIAGMQSIARQMRAVLDPIHAK